MRRGVATAKINLALVVGPRRDDGKHELATVYQRLALVDRVAVSRALGLRVHGFAHDTIVARALTALAEAADADPGFDVELRKRIPVAAGLGGGSSDAATALRLANDLLVAPLPPERLGEIAAAVGADVPFFLTTGPQLGTGDGTKLEPLDLPQDYWVLLVLPHDAAKPSTAAAYGAFDGRTGEEGYDERRTVLLDALERVSRPRDLAALPPNDLASSPLAGELRRHGAFRADVTGAGPAVYALFLHGAAARAAARRVARHGRVWLTVPSWYG
jgi:4-diphosphocytidyl-2-C-methyl-D-erythritol kinase